MAQESHPLTLRYSRVAESRLAEIWRWNAERYSEGHADAYIEFLRGRTRELQFEPLKGTRFPIVQRIAT